MTSTTSSSRPEALPKIVFYDIDHTLTPSTRSWSPATVRTLLALRYRKLPYTREAISYPDIAGLLKGKYVPPPAGLRVPYTLPAIDLIWPSSAEVQNEDSQLITTIMDSDPISKALETLVPVSDAHPSLFPLGEESHAQVKKIQAAIGAANPKIGKFVYARVFPFLDPRGREYFVRTRESWMENGRTFKDVEKEADMPEAEIVECFKQALGDFAKAYADEAAKSGKSDGIYFGGVASPSYADFVCIACIEWWRCAREKEVDRALAEADGGLFKKIHDEFHDLLY
ncbi:hypothetical protein AAFC00_006816 [Neodothiora populina]|uniref:Glutathione S-transferase UstS-like C-terminal domain-containing protein n=1 Tax=Neodothiora populina TaxID=2781224 RepID=A0ABR3PCJ5_9PEZI